MAVVLVAAVAGVAYKLNPRGTGASGLAEAIGALPKSGSLVLLEQERTTLVNMSAASRTLTVVAKPAMVSPSEMAAAQQTASNSSSGSSNSSSNSTGGTTMPPAPAPDPGSAQAYALSQLNAYGFGSDSTSNSQYTCLVNLWNRESGWNYQAENPYSGAYGIPQALPGSKMSSAGADWQTNPDTQIRWGLGYIQSVYGSPCNAWSNEVNYGYY